MFLFKIGRKECIQQRKKLIPELFGKSEERSGLHMFEHVSTTDNCFYVRLIDDVNQKRHVIMSILFFLIF